MQPLHLGLEPYGLCNEYTDDVRWQSWEACWHELDRTGASLNPLQLGDSYYPLDIVQGSKIMGTADITEGSDQVLEDLGHTPTRYEDEITWRMPTAAEATALHLGNGIPVGQVERLSYDQNDQPIELYVMTLPADRHVLLYEVDAE